MSDTYVVQLVKIPVSDIENALPFYRDILNLEEEFVATEYGWAQFKTSNISIALYVPGMGGGSGRAGASDALHLSISNASNLEKRLTDSGISTIDVFHQGNDGTQFYELKDPDGNLLKIFVTTI